MPCGSPKKQPRTSTIVQFIYYFWSFDSEKSENVIDSYILNIYSHLEPIWIYISHCMTSLLKLEITVWFLARLHEVQKSYCSHPGRTRSGSRSTLFGGGGDFCVKVF